MASAPSFAVFGLPGNDLLALCESKSEMNKKSCFFYIEGVLDGLATMQMALEYQKSIKGPICIPEKVEPLQLHDVVVQYLKKNPQERHKPATLLGFLAIDDAYPCK